MHFPALAICALMLKTTISKALLRMKRVVRRKESSPQVNEKEAVKGWMICGVLE
jgi:hypothetical protein